MGAGEACVVITIQGVKAEVARADQLVSADLMHQPQAVMVALAVSSGVIMVAMVLETQEAAEAVEALTVAVPHMVVPAVGAVRPVVVQAREVIGMQTAVEAVVHHSEVFQARAV
jgi:hypothetical protein